MDHEGTSLRLAAPLRPAVAVPGGVGGGSASVARPTPPDVTVVVPTTGRPDLLEAVRSVRAQDLDGVVEVVVVADGVTEADLPAAALPLVDRVVCHPERRGGGAARNSGVRAATGRYIAFLDDDDAWEPGKLTTQVRLAESAPDPARTVVTSRHVHIAVDRPGQSAPSPTVPYDSRASVAAYLFRRRKPGAGRASMYTSTLLCSRDLARAVPWDETLSRHQDWDWVVRLDRTPGVRFRQTPEALVRIRTGSVGSISAGQDWHSSLVWADARLREEPAVYADFLAAQSLRYAVAARSGRGVREVLRRLVAARQIPAAGPVLVGVGGLLPRRTIERLLRGRTATTGGDDAGSARPRLVVLSSARQHAMDRNPYLRQLQRSLVPWDVEVRPWHWRSALTGRYDLLHVHWPEYVVTHQRRKLAGLYAVLSTLLLARLRLAHTPVVVTRHNRRPHFALSRGPRRRLAMLERLTAHTVLLHGEAEAPARSTVVLHGSYTDWFRDRPVEPVRAGRLLFFGLIRPYKNVDALLEVFAELPDPELELHVVGQPTDPAEGARLGQLAARDRRVVLTPEFVDDDRLAREITAAQLVVLPYRDVFNSGAALLALSLGRPVLVADSPSMRELADEVGPEWVLTFPGELTSERLAATREQAVAVLDGGAGPDLHLRDWERGARLHREVFDAARAARRGRGSVR